MDFLSLLGLSPVESAEEPHAAAYVEPQRQPRLVACKVTKNATPASPGVAGNHGHNPVGGSSEPRHVESDDDLDEDEMKRRMVKYVKAMLFTSTMLEDAGDILRVIGVPFVDAEGDLIFPLVDKELITSKPAHLAVPSIGIVSVLPKPATADAMVGKFHYSKTNGVLMFVMNSWVSVPLALPLGVNDGDYFLFKNPQ